MPAPLPMRFWLSLLLVLVWLSAMAAAFWWFQLRWYQPPTRLSGDALFDADRLALGRHPAPATLAVVHFFDRDCPCTRFNTPHVQALIERYHKRAVRFHVLVPHPDQLPLARQLFPAARVALADAANRPPASPAALVLSPQGARYLGPWSPGAVCTADSSDYVAQVLDRLLAGRHTQQTLHLARGCLCPWPQVPAVLPTGVST